MYKIIQGCTTPMFQKWKRWLKHSKEFFVVFCARFFSLITKKAKIYRRLIALSYDLSAVIIALLLACWILIGTIADLSLVEHSFKNAWTSNEHNIFLFLYYWKQILFTLCWILVSQFIFFRVFGLYRGFWRFTSIQDLRKIVYVSTLGGVSTFLILWAEANQIIPSLVRIDILSPVILFPPYIVSLLYSVFLVLLLSSTRLFVRFLKDYKYHHDDYQRVIVVGAGNAGEGLIRDLLRDKNHRYRPVALVDDDLGKLGREIHNVGIVGTIPELPKLVKKYDIDLVLIAIPSASSISMRSVVDLCEKAKIRCYTLPSIKDLTNGLVSISVLRSISIEDLLSRYPISYQFTSTKLHLHNKKILVTGGGGSIGSELCRQILFLEVVDHLIIVDNNEYNLYSLEMNLRQKFPAHHFTTILLSITDRVGIQEVYKKYQPHLVFHAAAYKHVPLLEKHPRVAIYNNIIGTVIVAEEAVKAGIETFVLISSDKAVNPTNIMGATKRAAEYFCQNINNEAHKTKFITVRFGNVLDSAGSVIPLFRKQIETGGPVTVTHPDITRFFMTIPEASQLIMQAAFLGQGGEIFVLDMGDPIKIQYLAEQMIKLAGKVVDKDINISYIGLRPGEKLYEECFYPEERLQHTINEKILRAQSQQRNFKEVLGICQLLEKLCKNRETSADLIELLKTLVPEYQMDEERV